MGQKGYSGVRGCQTRRWWEMDSNCRFLVVRPLNRQANGTPVSKSGADPLRNRRFESISLQQRVCELSVPERRTDRREDNVAVVSRNFLFCPRPPGCGYVSTGGGARCSQRLWAAEVGHRWWRHCPQQIGKLGRGNGAAPRRMRCRSRQRAVQGSRPERRCAIDGRLALGVPSVHRRSSPRLVDGQCRQRGRRRRGLVRRFRARGRGLVCRSRVQRALRGDRQGLYGGPGYWRVLHTDDLHNCRTGQAESDDGREQQGRAGEQNTRFATRWPNLVTWGGRLEAEAQLSDPDAGRMLMGWRIVVAVRRRRCGNSSVVLGGGGRDAKPARVPEKRIDVACQKLGKPVRVGWWDAHRVHHIRAQRPSDAASTATSDSRRESGSEAGITCSKPPCRKPTNRHLAPPPAIARCSRRTHAACGRGREDRRPARLSFAINST